MIPNCNKLKLWYTEGGPDNIGTHHFTNTICKNCDDRSLFKFSDPSDGGLGWFGGCGDFHCTGLENIVLRDVGGKLSGL